MTTTTPSPATHRTEGQQIQQVIDGQDQPFDAETEEPAGPPRDVGEGSGRSRFDYTTFSRMRTSWIGDDLQAIERIDAMAARVIDDEFAGPRALIRRMHRAVRTPRAHPGGEIMMSGGEPVWELDEDGMPAEDWTLLSDDDKSRFLFTISTNMMDWQRRRTSLWRRAMFAKAAWEECFAKAFHALPGVAISGKPTIPDRTQVGHSFSIEQRYFAILQSSLSREADAVIDSMKILQTMLLRTVTS